MTFVSEVFLAGLGGPLPEDYRRFLEAHAEDLAVGPVVVLFGRLSLAEQNKTYGLPPDPAPVLIIGNDSGGRLLLLVPRNGRVGMIDAGDPHLSGAEPVAESFGEWLAAGCPLPEEPTSDLPERIDIYLVRPPREGLKGLPRILKLLDLQLPAREYRAVLAGTPYRLGRAVDSLRYGWRCAEYNVEDPCLGASEVDRPERPVALAVRRPPRKPRGLDFAPLPDAGL